MLRFCFYSLNHTQFTYPLSNNWHYKQSSTYLIYTKKSSSLNCTFITFLSHILSIAFGLQNKMTRTLTITISQRGSLYMQHNHPN